MCNCDEHSVKDAAATTGQGVTFQVSDMTCNHCAGTIRTAIEQAMPGAGVSIDLASKRVVVNGDPALAESAIATAGYTPTRAVN